MSFTKPYSVNIIRLMVQYLVGIAFILILASFIRPPEVTPPYDPLYIFAITEWVYDNMILFATMAAELFVDIVIVGVTLTVAEAGYIILTKLLEKLGPYVLAGLQLIADKKKENEEEE